MLARAIPLLALALLAAAAPARSAPAPAADHTIYLPALAGSPAAVLPGVPFDPAAARSGESTAYVYGGGNCSLDPLPAGVLHLAINAADYHGSLMCGAYLRVTGSNGSFTALVVDQCPECPRGNLDFTQPSLIALEGTSDGRHPVSWRMISPPLSGPIAYRFQGSNPYYIKVQVRNHRNPIFRVELRNADGSYTPLQRVSDNFFVRNGTPNLSAVSLRVTDIFGNQLTDSNIPIVNDVDMPGAAQLPAGPLPER